MLLTSSVTALMGITGGGGGSTTRRFSSFFLSLLRLRLDDDR
jgi:hypothetical protein